MRCRIRRKVPFSSRKKIDENGTVQSARCRVQCENHSFPRLARVRQIQGSTEEPTEGPACGGIEKATRKYEAHWYFRGPEPCFRQGQGIDGVLLRAALTT
jgi:hypothetical protein